MHAFEVWIDTPEGTRIYVLGDATVVNGRLVVSEMWVQEFTAGGLETRTARAFRLTEDSAEYLGRAAQKRGLDGVTFEGTRTGGAYGRRGETMSKRYPREDR